MSDALKCKVLRVEHDDGAITYKVEIKREGWMPGKKSEWMELTKEQVEIFTLGVDREEMESMNDKPLDWSKPIQRRDGAYAEVLALRGRHTPKRGVVVWPESLKKPIIEYYDESGGANTGFAHNCVPSNLDIINVPEEPETVVVYVSRSIEGERIYASQGLSTHASYAHYLGKLTIDIGELER